jgi:hypothetical protein
VAKFIPVVGIAVGIVLVAHDAHAKDYKSAGWDAAEAIPVVGDAVGAGHLGIAAGTAANAGLGIDSVAAEHGASVERAARSVGLGAGASQVLGATGAALSAISIAPTVAVQRKIANWF